MADTRELKIDTANLLAAPPAAGAAHPEALVSPRLESILTAYEKDGQGDDELLKAILLAKVKEDERLVALEQMRVEQLRLMVMLSYQQVLSMIDQHTPTDIKSACISQIQGQMFAHADTHTKAMLALKEKCIKRKTCHEPSSPACSDASTRMTSPPLSEAEMKDRNGPDSHIPKDSSELRNGPKATSTAPVRTHKRQRTTSHKSSLDVLVDASLSTASSPSPPPYHKAPHPIYAHSYRH